jgi:UTP--glucose-1-phosphate uridylyltransferase
LVDATAFVALFRQSTLLRRFFKWMYGRGEERRGNGNEREEDGIMDDYLDKLSPKERHLLARHHFDSATFEKLRRRFCEGQWSTADNRLTGQVELAAGGDIQSLPDATSEEGERLATIGREALERGEVGALVLNGGMATRFGSVVKGCVPVFDGYSFIGLKLADAASRGTSVPVLLMNSFATDDKTKEHLVTNKFFGFPQTQVTTFTQNISLRLTPEGDIFRTEEGETLYAPGHGDVGEVVRREVLNEFRARGGKYLLMSNVDNVLASLDPIVIGAHVAAAEAQGVEMTIETVDNQGSTTGGMPARVDGKLQVVEAFRFPQGFDVSAIPVYNTNTFLFTADALDRDFDLTWFVVEKTVQGKKAVQFERLAGQLSAFLKAQFLEVPRRGQASRFLPIKRREDLEDNREFLHRVASPRVASLAM